MKSKLFFFLTFLGLLSSSAEVSTEHLCNFYQARSPHPIVVKQVNFPQIIESEKVQMRTAQAEQVTHQVEFVLSFDSELQSASGISLISNDLSIDNWDCDLYELANGSNFMTIPEGEYDIVVKFDHYGVPNGWIPMYIKYVIREKVRIDHDMSFYFSSDEAKNHIHFQTMDIEGEPVNTGKIYVDEDGNESWSEQGNTDDVLWYTYLINRDTGIFETVSGNFGVEYEGSYQSQNNEQLADIYINDVSDRYVFYSYRVAYKGNVFYTSSIEVQGATENLTLSNSPSDFTLFEDNYPDFGHESENTYISLCQYCVKEDDETFVPLKYIVLTQPLGGNEKCKYYIGASTNTSDNGMVPMILPMRSYAIEYSNPNEEIEVNYQPIIIGAPIVKTDSQIKFINNGAGSRIYGGTGFYFDHSASFDENTHELGDIYSYSHFYPGHPLFSYDINYKKGLYLNNIPVLVSCPYQYENIDVWEDEEGNEYTDINRMLYFLYDYIGRFGEKNPADVRNTTMDIKVNDESFYSGKGKNSFQLEELIDGEIDATITDEVFVVDDMLGVNKSQLHFTLGIDDETPPTITMLQFKDNDGYITDRFATVNDGTLEFSAGDFNRKYSEMNWSYYDRIAPTKIDVSYSPYGEDNWNDLEVEEVPENYWPVMGWFYVCSLAGVTGQAEKGWFDLKFRLEDAAGNWQEQVVSPAFRIDDLAITGINEITQARHNDDNTIYNIAGQRMNGDINSLPRGIYIVGGKKIVK